MFVKYLILAVLCFACIISGKFAEAKTLGNFLPRPALAVYMVANEQPCTVRIVIKQGQRSGRSRFLVRAFDPDESLLLWKYVEYTDNDTINEIQVEEGIELRPNDKEVVAGEVLLEATVQFEIPGIHQIRVSNGSNNVEVEIELERDLPYGISFQNGEFRPWEEQPSKLYAYVPPHAEKLRLQGGPVVINDEDGTELARNTGKNTASDIPIKQRDTVWSFEFPQKLNWRFLAAGFPLILCPEEEAARAIKASIEVLPDGTVVCHRYQRKIAEILPDILKSENVGDAEDLIVPLSSRRDAWLADPLRNEVLSGTFLAGIEKWLGEQNVDPESHWGGSVSGWNEEKRWDNLDSVPRLYAGASTRSGADNALALAAVHDVPVNPYYGKKELLYRAVAAALRDLMVLGEDEVWRGVGADMTSYPGMMAFAMGQKTFPVYETAAPHLPEHIRAVWTDALRRIIDRHYSDELVTCRNQSSHCLVAFQAFANGSDDPLYRCLAKLYAKRWVAGQHPAGWHMEATGPDLSYQGMTHWHEAVYYRQSGDPVMLESLRRSYNFFNHTVAPEPDGKMLGGFNFGHRVGEGFYFEQWGGAKGIVDDALPEIGLWAELEERLKSPDSNKKATQNIERFLADPKHPLYPEITTARYLYWAEPDLSGTLPALEKEPFIRNFVNEMVAVKRLAYYAVCFTGKPVADEFYIRGRNNLRVLSPEENQGGSPDIRKITPYIGGGLTGFWTPEYGHVILAANWAPTTHHGLIATHRNGERYWEDYFLHEQMLDEGTSRLLMMGRIENSELLYTREYRFEDQALQVTLTLTARDVFDVSDLMENIPIAMGEWKARGVSIEANGKSEGEVESDKVTITDNTGAGCQIIFDREYPLRIVNDGLKTEGWRKLQIGRVEVHLPIKLEPDDTVEISYTLKPMRAEGDKL
ncbi:hypothetical protein ACFL6S_21180 [Candidatus Poribacteria bacterium]